MDGSAPGVVVVGAGQAAVQLAASLRDEGYAGSITLVGEESEPPYQRPPLSKAYLKGAAAAETLAFRLAEFYSEARVDLILGERVVAIERGENGSGRVECASGRRLDYSRLVLATGSAPRRLSLPGADADGVHVLSTLADATRLLTSLGQAEEIVVIGGGFIGLEVAATAQALGKSTVVVEAGASLMGRAVGPRTAEAVLDFHRASGVDVRLATSPARIHVSDGRATSVELADGTVLPAQVVVMGVGAEPRVELAERLGLDCDGGIVVDRFSVASDGSTIAIGDCARVLDPSVPDDLAEAVRLESVDNAVEQAKAAAATIVGRPRPYRGTPWFWSDQGSLKIQIVGLRRPGDLEVVRRHEGSYKQSVVYYRAGRMVAGEALNAPADFLSLKKALSAEVSFDPEAVADPTTALKSLIPAVAG